LRERAAEIGAGAAANGSRVLRLLDVGTGLGLNIAAALDAVGGTGVALDVVTIEHDASVIRAALELERTAPPCASEPPDSAFRAAHGSVLGALARSLEMSMSCASDVGASAPACVALGDGRLELHLGDARSVLPRLALDAAFDAVFLDPFSPRVEPELWQPAFLAEIARRMAPAAILSTYSSSASVRAALVAAGLRVGPGARVGTKAAGTVASPAGCVGELDRRTARRVLRRAIGLRPPT
jgi:tRNA U34 5-methylaminomethyl-2-thiouridine-forming methyltransferase MnmC